MIDAHCHLNDPELLPRVEELLAQMREAGVNGALVVGFDVASSQQAVELARRYPAQLRAAIGIHPHESKYLDDEALGALRELARCPEVVAVGEIGLDFHYDHSPREAQREAFRRQLALPRRVGAADCHSRARSRRGVARHPGRRRWPAIGRQLALLQRERGDGGGDRPRFLHRHCRLDHLSRRRRISAPSPARCRWNACWWKRTVPIWRPSPSAAGRTYRRMCAWWHRHWRRRREFHPPRSKK